MKCCALQAQPTALCPRYFRENPRLGGRERGVIAEAIYGLLRNKSVYTSFSESGSGSAMRRITLLGLADAVGIDALGGLTEEEDVWLRRVMEIDRSHLPLALKIQYARLAVAKAFK